MKKTWFFEISPRSKPTKLKLGTHLDCLSLYGFAKFQLRSYQSAPQNFTWTSRQNSPPRTVPALPTLTPKLKWAVRAKRGLKKNLFSYAGGPTSPSLLHAPTRLRCTYDCDPPNYSSRALHRKILVSTKIDQNPQREMTPLEETLFPLFRPLRTWVSS